MTNLRQYIKKQSHHFAYQGPYSQSYGFPSSHVQMWELDHKEGWALKNSCFWIVVLEKTLESSLDSKEIKPVNPKGNQSWILIGRTDAEAEAPILWPPDLKSQLIKKTLMLGKIEDRRRRGQQRIRMLDCITDSMDMSLSKLWEMVKDREIAKNWIQVSDWITTARMDQETSLKELNELDYTINGIIQIRKNDWIQTYTKIIFLTLV